MLYNGERIGDGHPPLVDIAVDPLEGTRLTALGMPNAITVIALAERGSMFDPGPCVYMEKLAGGPEIADLLDLERPLPETLELVARRKGTDIRDVMVVMLDRPRHEEQMRAVREAGARVRLITDGDVAASLLAVSENTAVDLLWGIGGTPEGVISAAAIKCLGGRAAWPPMASRRGRAHAGDRRRLRPSAGARRRGSGQGAGRLLLGDRGHRRRRAGGCPLPRRSRDDRVAGDAGSVRDSASGDRAARSREAAGARRRTLRLTLRGRSARRVCGWV